MSHVVKTEFFGFSKRNVKVQPCNLKNYSIMTASILKPKL